MGLVDKYRVVTWLTPCSSSILVLVMELEKRVGNAEEAVDNAREADTSNMCCVRYTVVGFS